MAETGERSLGVKNGLRSTAIKKMRALVIQPQGTEFCQQVVNMEEGCVSYEITSLDMLIFSW